jgi:hypothetical protein
MTQASWGDLVAAPVPLGGEARAPMDTERIRSFSPLSSTRHPVNRTEFDARDLRLVGMLLDVVNVRRRARMPSVMAWLGSSGTIPKNAQLLEVLHTSPPPREPSRIVLR